MATQDEKIESALYMVRNFMVGDDEQTRIEDEQYYEDLDHPWRDMVKALAEAGEYNIAIRIYVRLLLKNVHPDKLKSAQIKWIDNWLKTETMPASEKANERKVLTDMLAEGLSLIMLQ